LERHIPVFKVLQLTVHVRAKTNQAIRLKALSAELRQGFFEAQIWGNVPKNVCSIEDPQEYSGRSLEPPRLILELATRPN
jgi:hypothetical protein